MATSVAPNRSKKYEPKNPVFFNTLRLACNEACRHVSETREAVWWESPSFNKACGMIDILEYLNTSGFLAPNAVVQFGQDTHQIEMNLVQLSKENGCVPNHTLNILILKLRGFRMFGVAPSS